MSGAETLGRIAATMRAANLNLSEIVVLTMCGGANARCRGTLTRDAGFNVKSYVAGLVRKQMLSSCHQPGPERFRITEAGRAELGVVVEQLRKALSREEVPR